MGMDATFPRDVVARCISMHFVAVWTLELADGEVGLNRVGGFAGNKFALFYGEALKTGFAFDQPCKGHGRNDINLHQN